MTQSMRAASHEERLGQLKDGCEAGNLAAVYDALSLVEKAGLPCPDYLLRAAKDVVGERLANGKQGKEFYKRAKKYYRWAMVEHLMMLRVPAKARFRQAQYLLTRTFAFGGSATMKKSHQAVAAALADPEQAHLYLKPSAEVSALTNTPVIDPGTQYEKGQGKK